MLSPSAEVTSLPLIGPKRAMQLHNLEIYHVVDLLTHFPSRHTDSTNTVLIQHLIDHDTAHIKASVIKCSNTYTRSRKTITKALVTDGIEELELVWFNQPYLKNIFTVDSEFLFEIKKSKKSGKIYCSGYEKVADTGEQLHLGRISSTYPQTKGITSKWLRRTINNLTDKIEDIDIKELPEELISKYKLIDIKSALQKIHFPTEVKDIDIATKRLQFDELFSLLTEMEKKKAMNSKNDSIPLTCDTILQEKFEKTLPFQLTSDQNETISEIFQDLATDNPMHRILNGDVGSGKTIVAASAALQVLNSGHSVVVLAPTTILAKQHFATFTNFFKDFDVSLTLITSSERKYDIKDEKQLIIGTHALLFRNDLPTNIALVIIDEQHRFGVNQREQIRNEITKTYQPHYLSMTATPIPRTLTNVIFGDMDVSFIKSMPSSRKLVETHIVPENKRDSCYSWIRNKVLTENEQVYIVYPLIEEGMVENRKTVTEGYETLSRSHFPDIKTGILHGKMSSTEKNEIMSQFKEGLIKILFSTTVIEVGVDVPNATIMVIEEAERFGLAQLHQLRGRVGRGEKQSYTYLFPAISTEDQINRLTYFSGENSGFKIAEYDLQNRGPGEVFGTQQSGIPNLLIANIMDQKAVKIAKDSAKHFFDEDIETLFSIRRSLLEKRTNI